MYRSTFNRYLALSYQVPMSTESRKPVRKKTRGRGRRALGKITLTLTLTGERFKIFRLDFPSWDLTQVVMPRRRQ